MEGNRPVKLKQIGENKKLKNLQRRTEKHIVQKQDSRSTNKIYNKN